mmetsp:Transcript_18555/g.65637  ORF Transcript_18555/g.65637 Transcript_18555/m.65637 type:complete len:81 (-) Transcript_18555:277-519(-)
MVAMTATATEALLPAAGCARRCAWGRRERARERVCVNVVAALVDVAAGLSTSAATMTRARAPRRTRNGGIACTRCARRAA